MFTFNPHYQVQAQVPYYDMNSFVDFFDELQRAKQRKLAEQSRPKIVKKVEAEDKYQIQIFKEYGDFDSYEVKAVRDAYIAGVINIVIESPRDNFKKVFQFELNSIELEQIDWEYFESDNVLVLNIPKKVKVCCDSLEFGFPAFLNFDYPYHARQQKLRLREKQNEKHDERVRDSKVRKAEKAKRAEVRAARKAEEKAKKEAEEREAGQKARREAEEREAEQKARREAEQKARREEKARKEYLEAQKKRESETRAKREAYENAEKEKYEEYRKQQQEFLNQVFGGFFRQFEPQYETPSKPAEEKNENSSKRTVAEEKKVSTNSGPQEPESTENDNSELKEQEMQDTEHSDTESIESEEEDYSISELSSPVSTPSSPGSDSDIKKNPLKLHKLPSLEEVEDEEFVMFRKKFGK